MSSHSELSALLWASCSLLLPRLFPEKSVKNSQVSGGLPHQIQDKVLDFKARGVKHGGKEGGIGFCVGRLLLNEHEGKEAEKKMPLQPWGVPDPFVKLARMVSSVALKARRN